VKREDDAGMRTTAVIKPLDTATVRIPARPRGRTAR
jgi:hypothetical protein